jgi:oligosaccharide reducing-end xylanase
MNHHLPARGALALALLFAIPAFAQQPAARLDDGAGAVKTGHYRNLFVERLGVTPQQTRDRVERTFQQLFHGDGQEQRVYFETGANENGTLAYITDWANNDARTEGLAGSVVSI